MSESANANDNWQIGGSGSDKFAGGAGRDLLVIDATDRAGEIGGGSDIDTVLIADDRGVLLNLAQAKVEVVYGGYGNDVLTVNRKSRPNFKSCVTGGAVHFFAANNSSSWRDVA